MTYRLQRYLHLRHASLRNLYLLIIIYICKQAGSAFQCSQSHINILLLQFRAGETDLTTHQEVNSYPLTTVPLALATPERDLRQGSKAALRKYLIEESSSITEELPTRGNWLMMECLL